MTQNLLWKIRTMIEMTTAVFCSLYSHCVYIGGCIVCLVPVEQDGTWSGNQTEFVISQEVTQRMFLWVQSSHPSVTSHGLLCCILLRWAPTSALLVLRAGKRSKIKGMLLFNGELLCTYLRVTEGLNVKNVRRLLFHILKHLDVLK